MSELLVYKASAGSGYAYPRVYTVGVDITF